MLSSAVQFAGPIRSVPWSAGQVKSSSRARLVSSFLIPILFDCVSFVKVGSSGEQMDVLAEPVGRTLHFAGEATNRRYPASVHGAYMSGIREAKLVKVTADRRGVRVCWALVGF